jgi:hypothetical protein
MASYPYIRAWGRMMSSFPYYIEDQVREATRDKAPQDAIYKGQDGKWETYRDVTREDTRMVIDRFIAEIQDKA